MREASAAGLMILTILMTRKLGGNSNDPARFTIVNNKWEYFTIRLKVMFLLRGKQPCGISGIHLSKQADMSAHPSW